MSLSAMLLLHDVLLHQGVRPRMLDHHGMREESSVEWRGKGWGTILMRGWSHDGLLSKKLCWDSTYIVRKDSSASSVLIKKDPLHKIERL